MLASTLMVVLLLAIWRPIPAVVWTVDARAARAAILALSMAGWLLVLLSTFAIDHFELFGLRQPSPTFLGKARELADGRTNLAFEQADGRALPFEAESFELVPSDREGGSLAEARRRAQAGEFFGHIAYMSVLGRKAGATERFLARTPR